MRRDAQAYEAAEGVKIKHFFDKGMDIRGVMHVGTNWGEEIMYYLGMGIDHIIGFEPLESAFSACLNTYLEEVEAGKVRLFNYGLGLHDRTRAIKEITNEKSLDTGGSSFLEELGGIPPGFRTEFVEAQIKSFDVFLKENPDVNLENYNCLVVDVQGMELEVLQGIGTCLKFFDMLNIECSAEPIYKGSAAAQNVVNFLKRFGFKQETPIVAHDDILFVREF